MAELARGSVTDRPWGLTFGSLGVRGLTGQLVVDAGGKQYLVSFHQGAIIGAWSPLANDAAVRVALTSNLITSTQVADLTRRMAAAPDREELEVLAELARLSPEQAMKLRRRLIAQRAARVGSLERGTFVVDDEITLPYVQGTELDIRAVCYLATKTNFSEERLGRELVALGGWFRLKPDAVADLAQFGFTEVEKPALQMLLEGANLVEIEEAEPTLGARGVRAVTYALVSCAACEIRAASRMPTITRDAPPSTAPPSGRTPTPSARPAAPAGVPRAASPTGTSGSSAYPRAGTSGSGAHPRPTTSSVSSGSGAYPRAGTSPPVGRPGSPSSAPLAAIRDAASAGLRVAPPRRARRTSAGTQEIDQLLAHKIPLLDSRADHFTLLGLAQSATPEEVRQTYFMLARKLHPDRLSAIGVVDEARSAQRLMAQINAAFGVLNDATKRAEYTAILQRGGEAAVRKEEAEVDEMAMRVLRAEEAFHQGEMALRRDQLPQAIAAFQNAVELQPNESEYQALLAWAQFAAAPDKNAVATPTRRALQRAAEANDRSPTARFYLGRVERMLGKEREALQHFHEVLRIKPNHGEAASEARVLEQRLKGRR